MSTAILPTVTCRRCHQPINLGPQVRIDNDGRPIHERCFSTRWSKRRIASSKLHSLGCGFSPGHRPPICHA